MSSIKQQVIEKINSLPDNVTFSDIIEKIRFIQEVEQGLKQADAGNLISQEEIEKSLSKWTK